MIERNFLPSNLRLTATKRALPAGLASGTAGPGLFAQDCLLTDIVYVFILVAPPPSTLIFRHV